MLREEDVTILIGAVSPAAIKSKAKAARCESIMDYFTANDITSTQDLYKRRESVLQALAALYGSNEPQQEKLDKLYKRKSTKFEEFDIHRLVSHIAENGVTIYANNLRIFVENTLETRAMHSIGRDVMDEFSSHLSKCRLNSTYQDKKKKKKDEEFKYF